MDELDEEVHVWMSATRRFRGVFGVHEGWTAQRRRGTMLSQDLGATTYNRGVGHDESINITEATNMYACKR